MTEGAVTYDIRFHATVPKSGELIRPIINVEAQSDFYPGYPLIKRGIYYCSRMISSHYERIKKVVSIWVCLNPPKYRQNIITEYSITEKTLVGEAKEAEENYDLTSAVMICLGKPDGKNYSGILKLLEVLLSSSQTPEEKARILYNDFEIAITASLKRKGALMCNLSKGSIDETTLKNIRSLMETMKFTVWQAMDALKVPKDDQSKYASMLKKTFMITSWTERKGAEVSSTPFFPETVQQSCTLNVLCSEL